MTPRMKTLWLRLGASSLVLLSFVIEARSKDDEPTVIKDLHYGEVLFYYYQDDFFSAITRLQAAQELGRLPNHEEEADLLLGALYLSYGQHSAAGEIFARLLEGKVDDSVRDRTWFYLAKIWYQRGYLVEAEQALNSIKGKLPKRLAVERPMLLAQIQILDGRYDEAVEVLDSSDSSREWRRFALYNLGIAMIRQGRVDDGARLLERVGAMNANNEEMEALRDKANVALGYAYLQEGKADTAKPLLQRVRLDGPFSNKALLGVGWADSIEERYEKALVPWMELSRRDLLDPAVQESLLAVPYAFGKLSANRQAADHYLDAIEAFTEEMGRLERSIDDIRQGYMLDLLLGEDVGDTAGWFWYLEDLPPTRESQYLYHLLARHEFQEALKSLRDLRFMRRNLTRWTLSLDAFADMIETREVAFAQRLPVVDTRLDQFDLDAMIEQRFEFESRINEIERSGDIVGLATAREQRLWADLQEVEAGLDSVPAGPAVDEARDKLRLLKGVLYWDLSQNYKARLWRNRQAVKKLDLVLKDAQKRWVLVQRARVEMPKRTAEFADRVLALLPRLSSIVDRTDAAIEAQEHYLKQMAIDELEAQRLRLETYLVQARFALASIYDRSADARGVP